MVISNTDGDQSAKENILIMCTRVETYLVRTLKLHLLEFKAKPNIQEHKPYPKYRTRT